MCLGKKGTVLALFVLITSLGASAQVSEMRVLRLPQDIVFTGPTAVLYGDPRRSGMYVYRSKLAQGTRNMPHWHPEERTVAILSGTLYYGLGDQWEDSKLIAFPAGTFFSEPPKTTHFAWAKDGEVILQVTGIAPTGTTFVQPPVVTGSPGQAGR
jgi:quercetin dioxygenase-like cupin family protein